MKSRSALRRRILVVGPLLAAVGVAGWLLVPSRSLALAAATANPPNVTVPGVSVPSSTVPGGRAPVTSTTTQPPRPAPAGSGGVPAVILYQDNCAACHGDNGLGTNRAPSLAGVGEAAVDFQLTTGRMPKKDSPSRREPYRPFLSAADIRALDQYVTNLVAKGGPAIPAVNPAAGNLSKGETLYMENCAACHQWGGQGGILFSRPVPKITEATPTQVGEALRTGPSAMPVFGPGEISHTQLNDIVAYVESLKKPYDAGSDPISHLGPFAEGAVIWLIAMTGIIFATRWIGKRG